MIKASYQRIVARRNFLKRLFQKDIYRYIFFPNHIYFVGHMTRNFKIILRWDNCLGCLCAGLAMVHFSRFFAFSVWYYRTTRSNWKLTNKYFTWALFTTLKIKEWNFTICDQFVFDLTPLLWGLKRWTSASVP